MKKICVFSSNRSEYTRLKSVMRAIQEHPDLKLYTVVAGSHLLFRYGLTKRDIEADGFPIYEEIYTVVEGENPVAMGKSAGLAIVELTTCLNNIKPDYLVVVGDRYDVLPAVIAASYVNIPVAHIQGGEITGSIDEVVRHAVTKFAHIHFPATEKAKEVILRMGEHPDRVFTVGCPSIDLLLSAEALSKKELFCDKGFREKDQMKLDPEKPFLLVVQHPVTTEYEQSCFQITETLKAVEELKMQAIMIYPNLDAGSDYIVQGITRFVSSHDVDDFLILRKHFSMEQFFNLLRTADCVVGNSSAGIRESCYFGTPAVNIGTRQNFRQRGLNVIQVDYNADQIVRAVRDQLTHGKYSPEYIYGDGHSGQRIAGILAAEEVAIQKTFYQSV